MMSTWLVLGNDQLENSLSIGGDMLSSCGRDGNVNSLSIGGDILPSCERDRNGLMHYKSTPLRKIYHQLSHRNRDVRGHRLKNKKGKALKNSVKFG